MPTEASQNLSDILENTNHMLYTHSNSFFFRLCFLRENSTPIGKTVVQVCHRRKVNQLQLKKVNSNFINDLKFLYKLCGLWVAS